MYINKSTEAEIDTFLKNAQVHSWHRGYRYLKDVIIYSIDHPDKNIKEGCSFFAQKYGTTSDHIYRAIASVVKDANIEGKPNALPKEFINMCIASLSYTSLHGEEQ